MSVRVKVFLSLKVVEKLGLFLHSECIFGKTLPKNDRKIIMFPVREGLLAFEAYDH